MVSSIRGSASELDGDLGSPGFNAPEETKNNQVDPSGRGPATAPPAPPNVARGTGRAPPAPPSTG